MQAPWAIRTQELTKVYASRKHLYPAVSELHLRIAHGQTVGFLGANGAGKTTTIKMLLNFIRPTRGWALLYEMPCTDHRARQHVGYMPEQPYFARYLTPRELLSAHAALAGVPYREVRHRVELALEMARADGFAHRPIGKLSKGMTQRVALAQALVGDPRLLILDEPASGLDPVSRVEMRNVLQSLKEQGKTIFLSSHHLGEVELICDRVAIIHQGRLLAFGAPEELILHSNRFTINATQVRADVEGVLRSLCIHAQREGCELCVTVEDARVYEAIRLLSAGGAQLVSVQRQKETLEEAFLRIVQQGSPRAIVDRAA